MNADRSGYYLDPSAILPYSGEEKTSQVIQEFLLTPTIAVVLSDLTLVALAFAVSRWVRIKELTEAQASLVENRFKEDARLYTVDKRGTFTR